MQSRVDATGGKERLMCASFDNTALMQDENERGTHESLLTAGGVYAGLHEEFSRHHE